MKSYSVKEVADMLGTNPETVRRWIRSGKLEATRGASRKEGNSVSSEALKKFMKIAPKYAAAVGAAMSSPAAIVSASVLAAIGGAVAAKSQSEADIANAAADATQISKYLESEVRALEESISRKEETISQLKQDIEKDRSSLIGLKELLDQIKDKN